MSILVTSRKTLNPEMEQELKDLFVLEAYKAGSTANKIVAELIKGWLIQRGTLNSTNFAEVLKNKATEIDKLTKNPATGPVQLSFYLDSVAEGERNDAILAAAFKPKERR
jgi:hypothetical protein